jgi:hypothetical protein
MNNKFIKWAIEIAINNHILLCINCPVNRECYSSDLSNICGSTLNELDDSLKEYINKNYRHIDTQTIWTVIEEFEKYLVLDDGCDSPIKVPRDEINGLNWFIVPS